MVTSNDLLEVLDRYPRLTEAREFLRTHTAYSEHDWEKAYTLQDVVASPLWNEYFRQGLAHDIFMRLFIYAKNEERIFTFYYN